MTIKPSAAIRGEAVLKLREDLLTSEEEMLRGEGCSVEETVAAMKRAALEVGDAARG